MNKFGVVLGIAAVATLAGCKDPDFKRAGATNAQNDVKSADTTTVVDAAPPAAKCTCAPGTKHAEPCKCGAQDCKCIVETKPVAVADVSKPAEPEYTIYVVQNGDYLAKISKKYNVTISSIKRLNPSIKKDVIWVGQKIKLPGKIDVGVQTAPAVAKTTAPAAKKTVAKKGFTPYTGATKEYVVKSGDTLGGVAYGNGINIRQLKELNGLSSDSLKVGQKLKVPAVKAAAPAVAKAEEKPVAKAVEQKAEAPVAEKAEEKPAEETAAPAAAEAKDDAAAALEQLEEKKAEKPADAPAMTYLVQEGDDMTGVSIRWGVSAADIRELNNMAEGDQLVPGQVIKLPADAQQ